MTEPLLLLVDDAREMGLIVGRLGRRAGCVVEHRPDAATAREFLRDCLPDLMLLDVNLVGESGPELCRSMRADARLADLPVALFTHPGMGDDIAEGLEAGADYLFSKDLVVCADAWKERLTEILVAVRSRRATGSLRSRWDDAHSLVPADWPAVLNGALRLPVLRGLAPSVVRALLRRALSQVFVPPDDTDCWLTADGCALDPTRVPPAAGRDAAKLAAALAEQMWCVTGTTAVAPFRAALAAVFPGLREPLTR
jgi:CheY-like chemotaxis protein